MIWDSYAFKGTVVALKKHTKGICDCLEESLIVAVFRASQQFGGLMEDLEKLKRVELEDDEVFQILGLLFGHGILSTRQFVHAMNRWKMVKNKSGFSKNLHGLYGICSLVLKHSQPLIILDNYVSLHNDFMKIFG